MNVKLALGFWLLAASTIPHFASAALPLPWRADWPDCKPVEKLLHRGVDVALHPTFYVNGLAADTNGWQLSTYVQTNAVGAWFGPLPGAFFSHTNDVGAAFYNVMVRAEAPEGGVNYTAFARFRMLDSPGFTPGELPLPAKFIDFADVTVINPPWGDVDFSPGNTQLVATIEAVAPAPGNYAVVSNAAMNALSRAEAEAGFTEWVCEPSTYDGGTLFIRYNGGGAYLLYTTSNPDPEGNIGFVNGAANATSVVFRGDIDWAGIEDLTATRARLPTMADIPAGSTSMPYEDSNVGKGPGTSSRYAREDHVHPSDSSKQNTISDLAAIRSGAQAGATAYQKPPTGIPSSDMASAVQASLGKADTAIQSLSPATNYTDSAIADADTSYRRFTGVTNVNQTVQFVQLDASQTSLAIELPSTGETRDWIVYVYAAANAVLSLPSGVTWWTSDVANTNAIEAATPTALYFSQISTNIFMLGRQTLTEVSP